MEQIIAELKALGNSEKQEVLSRFFKTGKGEYGEGDLFMGITMPQVRSVAKKHKTMALSDVAKLLMSPWHEVRQCALFILILQFKRANREEQSTIVNCYLQHTAYINNWDLVDASAPYIIGTYLLDKPRDLLYRLAESESLWENRIAMIATWGLIKHNHLDDTYALATKFMHHSHDLMHKAVGWMLREAGKKDEKRLLNYIYEYGGQMPRTMLRYAIEKFEEAQRKIFLALPRT